MLKEKGLKLDGVVELKVDGDILRQRIESRIAQAIARGEALRSDDDPEVLKRRVEAYREQTAPLVDYYRWQGSLKSVDGMEPIEEVAAAIDRALSEPPPKKAPPSPQRRPPPASPRRQGRRQATEAKAKAKARRQGETSRVKADQGRRRQNRAPKPASKAEEQARPPRKAAKKPAAGRAPARGKAAPRKSKRQQRLTKRR